MGLEPAKIWFEAILTVPVAPKGLVFSADNWAQGMKDSPDKIKKGIRNAIRKFRDLLKEIAQSRGITVVELLKDPFFAHLQRSELKKWRKMREALKPDADGSTRYGRGVEAGKMDYERYKRECYYPLFGSEKDGVKGLIWLGIMALTGDRHLKEWLKPGLPAEATSAQAGLDKIITGEPVCICPPEKLKEFRLRLKSLLAEFGWIIIDSNFKPEMLKLGSEKLNRLVESYCLQGFAPHVDFIVVEIPDTPRNNRDSVATSPGRKLLALDIRVARK